jgi:16S rRNA (guanine527-N7)-methyltransferase
MTEAEAMAWLAAQGWADGPAGERLHRLAALVVAENDRQNLIAASTVASIWSRHIVDSAQLLVLARDAQGQGAAEAAAAGHWVDLGSGGGFPGLAIACLRDGPVTLVEVRLLRARFLAEAAAALGLYHVSVVQQKAEAVRLDAPAAILSARAFAPLDRLMASAVHLSGRETLWLLPKGQKAQLELVTARKQWQAVFHVEQSVTDPGGAIVMARSVGRRTPVRPQGRTQQIRAKSPRSRTP